MRIQIIKTHSAISFEKFILLVKGIKEFRSKTGNLYTVVSLNDHNLRFIRESTNIEWEMDLKKVYHAYQELKDFKTINLKAYVPRRQSPALGLLITTKLLQNT